MFHDHPVRLTVTNRPGLPADEAVDRVSVLGFVQLELMALPVELVAPVLQPVRPRDQDLTAARGARPAGWIAVEKVTPVGRIRANPAPDLVQDGSLVVGKELDLIARLRRHYCLG